jgi:hypothetical protein
MARILVALLLAVIVGAAALPVSGVGIGWLIVALAVLAVAIVARTARGSVDDPSAPPPVPPGRHYPDYPSTTAPCPSTEPAFAPSAPAWLSPGGAPVVTAPPAPVAPAEITPAGVVTAPGQARTPPIAIPLAPVSAPAQQQTTGDRVWRWAAAACAVLLVAVPAVRASGGLAFLCEMAAVMLASYALVGGRTWGAVIGAGFMLVPGLPLAVAWLARYRPRPARSGTRANPWRVLFALVVAVVLAAILIPLLRSADPVFANLLDQWIGYLPRLDGRSVSGALIIAMLGIAAAYLAFRGPAARSSLFTARAESTVERRRPLTGPDWALPLIVVDVIFAVFVAVQVPVLFGGHEYVLGAGGPDYADYARSGFAELCAVTAISLGLAALLAGLARRETRRQQVMVRVLGGLLCALTLVIVVSALRRMLLYIDVYGLTWLRLNSFAFEVFLGLVFVLLLIAGLRLRGAWLPRTTGAAAVVVLFTLVAVNPEGLMARTTIDARLNGPYVVDLAYLNGLSADAVDEILALPADQRACALAGLRDSLGPPDPWYHLNLAREHARAALADLPTTPCNDPPPGSGS